MNEQKESSPNLNQTEKNNDALKDYGGFYISTSIKITDPDTKEVILQIRGDS